MQLGICLLQKSYPLHTHRGTISKQKLVNCRLNRKQLVHHYIDRLEFFIKFEDIKAILNEKFEKIRINSLNSAALVFFANLISLTFYIRFFVCNDAKRRNKPTVAHVSLHNLIRIQLLLQKYHLLRFSPKRQQLLKSHPLYFTFIWQSRRRVAFVADY